MAATQQCRGSMELGNTIGHYGTRGWGGGGGGGRGRRGRESGEGRLYFSVICDNPMMSATTGSGAMAIRYAAGKTGRKLIRSTPGGKSVTVIGVIIKKI